MDSEKNGFNVFNGCHGFLLLEMLETEKDLFKTPSSLKLSFYKNVPFDIDAWRDEAKLASKSLEEETTDDNEVG